MPIRYVDQQLSVVSESPDRHVPLAEVADKFQKPVYVYDVDEIERRLDHIKTCFTENTTVHYAMKANSHPAILKLVAAKNMGVDVVSAGEINLAVEAGISPQKIVFSGVGKSISEINRALDLNIKQINVESPSELRRIGELAKAKNKPASIALRMNPDVDPDTHPYIKTGFRDNKFGMDESFLPELESIFKQYPEHLALNGLTLHIGSQIRELDSFKDAIAKTLPLFDYLKDQGYPIQRFDIGGGIGISYTEENGDTDYK